MSENQYDEKNIRSPMRCRARIEETNGDGRLQHSTLILSVCDGPETFSNFAPSRDVDSNGEGPLTDAIAEGVNRMIEAALENEAGRWIEDHEEVYLVVGKTGQGPDAQEWNVKAFLSRDRAHRFCYDLNQWLYEHGLQPGGSWVNQIIDPTGVIAKHPGDPNFRIDGGTEYEIVSIPLDMFDPIRD
jgi:hypothetical protein